MKNAVAFPKYNLKPNGPILKAVINARKKLGIDIIGWDNYKGERYDNIIYLNNKLDGLPEEVNAKVGWWMNDLRTPKELGNYKRQIDHIFLCNTEFQDSYEKYFNAPTHFLPQCGLDEEPGQRLFEVDWDIIFIGRFGHKYHQNRRKYINAIKKKYKFRILSGQKYTWASRDWYYYSPFCLSVSQPVGHYTSNRTYNILASNGFCLTLYFPGIEDLFENHKHLVWFKTPKEATELIDYYYSHPKEYAWVRKEGAKLYAQKHTAEARLKNGFAIMEGKETEFRGFL